MSSIEVKQVSRFFSICTHTHTHIFIANKNSAFLSLTLSMLKKFKDNNTSWDRNHKILRGVSYISLLEIVFDMKRKSLRNISSVHCKYSRDENKSREK